VRDIRGKDPWAGVVRTARRCGDQGFERPIRTSKWRVATGFPDRSQTRDQGSTRRKNTDRLVGSQRFPASRGDPHLRLLVRASRDERSIFLGLRCRVRPVSKLGFSEVVAGQPRHARESNRYGDDNFRGTVEQFCRNRIGHGHARLGDCGREVGRGQADRPFSNA